VTILARTSFGIVLLDGGGVKPLISASSRVVERQDSLDPIPFPQKSLVPGIAGRPHTETIDISSHIFNREVKESLALHLRLP